MKFLLGTEALKQLLKSGDVTLAAADVAVSEISFQWLLADIERSARLKPDDRIQWRSNVVNFRQLLVAQGGRVLGLSRAAIEIWGRLAVMDLAHTPPATARGKPAKPKPLASEERLVIATAIELGLIYLTPLRDWIGRLSDAHGLAYKAI